MEIIIIMVVVGIIANIMKAAGQAQQQTNQTGRGIPEQGNLPGRGFQMPGNQPPSFDTISIGEMEYQIGRTPSHQKRLDRDIYSNTETEASSPYQSGETRMIVDSQATPINKMTRSMQEIHTDQGQKGHKLDFSRDGFINGIILSEVLAPPKSRR